MYYGYFTNSKEQLISFIYNENNEKTVEDNCSNNDLYELCQYCFYCGVPLPIKKPSSQTAKAHQHDHFPIPYTKGGQHVVPACSVCHQWKDNIPEEKWPAKFLEDFWVDLEILKKEEFPFTTKEKTLDDMCENALYFYSLLYWLGFIAEAPYGLTGEELEDYLNVPMAVWEKWRQGTRLKWAKIVRIFWEETDIEVEDNFTRGPNWSRPKEDIYRMKLKRGLSGENLFTITEEQIKELHVTPSLFEVLEFTENSD